jgi:hypothetical protein
LGRLSGVLPVPAQAAVDDYLHRVDRALPGRIEGFYVVGSASMGGFRAGRSDLDFVAVIGGDLERIELERLRSAQRQHCRAALIRAAVRGPWEWPVVCNGVYVRWADLARSPLEVLPSAAHVAGRFSTGNGFDVNPVTWRTLARRGIPIRGPQPGELAVLVDDRQLRKWTLHNLNTYWRSWASAVARGYGAIATKALLRRHATWGVLGAPRLHFTLRTSEIATKEHAAEYAMDAFGTRWHPILREGLAFWRGSAPVARYRNPTRRRRDAAEFVITVIDSANTEPSG